ncbi:MAG: DUF1801 domain-containing protein [Gemmatimonadaceae bacterium]|jgi:uncharacterized protein YdhG (YjbR/CyaY superfamily)|nr:DUF1801 domain-containing protein [Gemmatimonadaceae bacterium]
MTSPVDRYLAALPSEQSDALKRLRSLLQELVPDAEEAIKTRVPAIRYRDKTVVGFGASKGHLSLYVMFGDALRAFAKDFAGFDVGYRVVRFTPDHPIPDELVRKVVRYRLAEITQPQRTTRA